MKIISLDTLDQHSKIIAVFLFFLSFSISLSVASDNSDNYFNRIASISDGKLTRFVNMPIRVYIEPIPDDVGLKEDYTAELNYALKAWHEGSNDKVSFQIVHVGAQQAAPLHEADIRVSWLKNPLSKFTDTNLGEAELIRDGSQLPHD